METPSNTFLLLYKFLPLSSFQKTLQEWALKASLRFDVNDPLENVPIMANKDEKIDEIEIPPFFSFSRNMSVTAMWGHYADDAKGICMAFLFPVTPHNFCEKDSPEDARIDIAFSSAPQLRMIANDTVFLRLRYTNNRAEKKYIKSDKEKGRTIDWTHELMKFKAECWSYEDEVRVLCDTKHIDNITGNIFCFSWPMQFFIGAIVGPKCPITPALIKQQIQYYYSKHKDKSPNYIIQQHLISDWIVEKGNFDSKRFAIVSDTFSDCMFDYDFRKVCRERGLMN